MTPEVRIRAIRMMERFCEQTDYLHSIGVDIAFRNSNIEPENDHADD